jgi:hypothetical protein
MTVVTHIRVRIRSLFAYTKAFANENRTFLVSILIFFLIWKAFYTCLGNGFVNYDDSDYVWGNEHVKSGLSVGSIRWAFSSTTSHNWHPITMLSHIVDWQLYGESPKGHHCVNVILHCFNTILVFLVLQRGTGLMWRCFAVALFFGLHPLRVESVAWISERKDVLSSFFWLLALMVYMKYVSASRTNGAGSRYVYAIVVFLASLMCKPMGVTLPFVLLLLDFWPLRRLNEQSVRAVIMEKWPFFLLSGIFSVITIVTQVGSRVPLRVLPLSARLENLPISYCRYLGKLLYPVDLAVFYPHPGYWPGRCLLFSATLIVAITAIAVVVGRRQRYLVVGWLWFVGVLFPVIGLMQAGEQSIADRYTYIPSIGVCIVCIWSSCEIWKLGRFPLLWLWLFAGAVGVTCFTLTRQQICHWRDSEALFRHAAAVTESNYTALGMIGYFELARSNYDSAIPNFQRALEIQSGKNTWRIFLGIAQNRNGQPEEAISTLRQAIFQEPSNAEAYKELALALLAAGRRDEARTNLLLACQLQSSYLEAEVELRKLTNCTLDAGPK